VPYGPLTSDTLYLRSVFFGDKPDDLISEDAKTAAETYADSIINGELDQTFETVGEPAAYPPMIVAIAEMLGAAQIYRELYAQQLADGEQGDEKTPAEKLEERAYQLLEKIKDGRLTLFDAAGEKIDGFDQSEGRSTSLSIAEKDESLIFDIRATPEEYEDPHDAYGEPAY
jgi:hypothetical protein